MARTNLSDALKATDAYKRMVEEANAPIIEGMMTRSALLRALAAKPGSRLKVKK